ncbi:MAG: glycosyltransferase, partial [Kovacikia sp.]
MKGISVLHLSESDIDNGGARAAYRLNKGLQSIGCTSQMLVRAKVSADKTVISEKSVLTKLGPSISGIPLNLFGHSPSDMFSPQWFPDVIASKAAKIHSDILNLHWVCNGFLRIESIAKMNKPLVWTLHDMWPFTGGCHYSGECEKYIESCGSCPQLQSNHRKDISTWVWQRKVKKWSSLNVTIVSPSSWLAACAQASSLFKDNRIEVIPNGVDPFIYRPINRYVAREILNVSPEKQYILFGSMNPADPRKGFQLLQPA